MANKNRKELCQYDISESEDDDEGNDAEESPETRDRNSPSTESESDLPMAYKNHNQKSVKDEPVKEDEKKFKKSKGGNDLTSKFEEKSQLDDHERGNSSFQEKDGERHKIQRRDKTEDEDFSKRHRDSGRSKDGDNKERDDDSRRHRNRSRSPDYRSRRDDSHRDGWERSSHRRHSRNTDYRHSRDNDYASSSSSRRRYRDSDGRRDDRDDDHSSSYFRRGSRDSQRVTEQMQKRKLLWQGNKEKTVAHSWETMLAACTDEKQAEKLKKMIGLRDDQSSSTEGHQDEKPASDFQEAKKQKEIARNLQQQYDLARMSTHTHRGMGLGFTSQFSGTPSEFQTISDDHAKRTL